MDLLGKAKVHPGPSFPFIAKVTSDNLNPQPPLNPCLKFYQQQLRAALVLPLQGHTAQPSGRAPCWHQDTPMVYMLTIPYNHGHHRRHRVPQQTPENPATAPQPPDAMEARCRMQAELTCSASCSLSPSRRGRHSSR